MPETCDTTFPHQRLLAYQLALRMAVAAKALSVGLLDGHGKLRDQLDRATVSAVLNLAEGANRWSNADKRNRFAVARSAPPSTASWSIPSSARFGRLSPATSACRTS